MLTLRFNLDDVQLIPQPEAFAAALATLGSAGDVLLTLAAADSARGPGQRATLDEPAQKALHPLVKATRDALSSKRLRKAALPRSVRSLVERSMDSHLRLTHCVVFTGVCFRVCSAGTCSLRLND